MKFGLSLPAFGDFADPLYLADSARQAEAAGWDGFFLWDHVIFDPTFHPMADPWVALAACAMSTRRMRLGPMVTPLARRRPWQVARQAVTLDRLSGGRLILGVGLGEPPQWDFGFFGEEQDAKIRAEKLDEGLEIIRSMWGGERFSFTGRHYTLAEMIFRPRPLQTPRIPVWVGGSWNKHAPMRRAAKWDGWFPLKWQQVFSPAEWQENMDYVNQHRTSGGPYDWIHGGVTPGDDPVKASEIVKTYADIGVTWWIESVDPWRFGADWEEPLTPEFTKLINERILRGPPKLP